MQTFAERLKDWRAHRGLSQRGLDDAMNRKRSFTSNIESGLVKPPDQATCLELGEVLGIPGHVVWKAARSERLRLMDEELWSFYEGDADVAALDAEGSPKTLTPEQDELLEYFVWLDQDFPAGDGTCLAEHLSLAALTVFVEAETGPGRKPSALAERFVSCIRRFSTLSPRQQRGLLKIFVVACETVSDSAR
jgi:transcriptional regulator with XRE-family HTH domain